MKETILSRQDFIKSLSYYLAGIFLIGFGYISILPPFEGFDETAHYSRIREIIQHPSAALSSTSFLDELVVNYTGPVAYTSGQPPFNKGNVYSRFFANKSEVENSINKYWNNPVSKPFTPSNERNWQSQHPPLYYALLAPLTIDKIPLIYQVYLLRVVSFCIGMLGILFGVLSIRNIYLSTNNESDFKYSFFGFMIYPIIFPMFFIEFARIGNDSLCLCLVGALSYLITSKLHPSFSTQKLALIGFVLGLGLLTKALFLPITAAFLLYISIKYLSSGISKSNLLSLIKTLATILSPVLALGGSWYLFKILMYGDFGVGAEVGELGDSGGFFAGLIQHFSFFGFIRGTLVPLASFSWAGSWSLVRMPEIPQAILMAFGFWLLYLHALNLKTKKIDDFHWLGLWMFLLIYLGLVVHVLISMALSGLGTSGGWYLHILMPWIAPAIGLVAHQLTQYKLRKFIFITLLFYAFVFQMLALWANIALFAGLAIKADDKHFSFTCDMFCLNKSSEILSNLSMISFPYIGLISLVIGFIILAHLTINMLCKSSTSEV